MTSSTRIFRRLASSTALATAIVVITTVSTATAADRPAASYYTPTALEAMGERYQAAADFYRGNAKLQLGVDRPAASYYTTAALEAMGERYQAATTFYQQVKLRNAQRAASAFHWRDAVIGAGLVLALGGLALAGIRILRRGRRPSTA